MDQNDLIAYAKECASKGEDLYSKFGLKDTALLNTDEFQREVQSSWRKKALKYHPDKAGDKYDEGLYRSFERARDVLLDTAARAAYDGSMQAALRKRQELDQMSAKRRQKIEDLERREREAREGKKPRTDSPENTISQAKLDAMAELGRKKMEERKRLIREAEERERAAAATEKDVERPAMMTSDQKSGAASTDQTTPATSARGAARNDDDNLDAREADIERQIRERKAQKQKRKEEKRARKGGVSPAPPEAEEKPSTAIKPQIPPPQNPGTQAYVQKDSPVSTTTTTGVAPKKESAPLMERLRAAQAKRDAEKKRKALQEAEKGASSTESALFLNR